MMKSFLIVWYVLWVFLIQNYSKCTSTQGTSPTKAGEKRRQERISIDLNQPALEGTDEEKSSKILETERNENSHTMIKYKKYMTKLNNNPPRKQAWLEHRRVREKANKILRFEKMTEDERIAYIERDKKRKHASYEQRKVQYGGMSSKKVMEMKRISTLIKEGKDVSEQDLLYHHQQQNVDREKKKNRRLRRISQRVHRKDQ